MQIVVTKRGTLIMKKWSETREAKKSFFFTGDCKWNRWVRFVLSFRLARVRVCVFFFSLSFESRCCFQRDAHAYLKVLIDFAKTHHRLPDIEQSTLLIIKTPLCSPNKNGIITTIITEESVYRRHLQHKLQGQLPQELRTWRSESLTAIYNRISFFFFFSLLSFFFL